MMRRTSDIPPRFFYRQLPHCTFSWYVAQFRISQAPSSALASMKTSRNFINDVTPRVMTMPKKALSVGQQPKVPCDQPHSQGVLMSYADHEAE